MTSTHFTMFMTSRELGKKNKEYVSLLIGLYKNNGSVSYVENKLMLRNKGCVDGQFAIETETHSYSFRKNCSMLSPRVLRIPESFSGILHGHSLSHQ